MINLEKISGLPAEVTDDFHLKLNFAEMTAEPVVTRKFEEMIPVLMDDKAKSDRDEMYYMYRRICMNSDKDLIAENHLDYDITIVPPAMIGKEYNKTLGHYHANIPGTGIAHPEMYEVLNGKGLFILQKMDSEFKDLITILAIEAEVGDKIIYPPNYGHIIVNIGSDALVTANWVSSDCKSLYEPVKEKHGMALYVVKGDDGQPTFIKNKNYKEQPMMRKMSIADKIRTDFGMDVKVPMYSSGVKNPKILDFLNNPSKYAVELSALSS